MANVKAENKTKETNVDTVVIKLPRIKNAEDPVFVSVNEYTCFIKRGESVEVPAYVAEVLEQSERMQELAAKAEEEYKYND